MGTGIRRLSTLLLAGTLLAVAAPSAQAAPDGGPNGAAWTAAVDGPSRYSGVTIEWDVPITMSDGTVLKANIYRPAGATGPTPVIVNMTPYTKLISMMTDSVLSLPVLSDALVDFFRGFDLAGTGLSGFTDLTKALGGGLPRTFTVDRKLVESGYTQVVVDVRGTGFSQGTWQVLGQREQQDTVEVIDWASRQSWSDGKVGMSGLSYSGINQVQAASKNPAALKAIFPAEPGADLIRDVAATGGALGFGFILPWLILVNTLKLAPDVLSAALGRLDPVWVRDRLSSPFTFLDVVYQALATMNVDQAPPELQALLDDQSRLREDWLTPMDQVRVPTFVVGGWHDLFTNTEPDIYRKAQLPPGQKQLLMDRTYHINGGANAGRPGEPPRWDVLQRAWFDHWLKGIDNGIDRYGPVTMWQLGGGWTTAADYPRPGVEPQRLYLGAAPSGTTSTSLHDGSLSATAPADSARLTVGPGVMSVCSRDSAIESAGLTAILVGCAEDARPHELNGLTFTSAPVDRPTAVSGYVNVHLNTVLDAPDGYWTATLNDVAPDGRSTVLSTGQLVASLRAVDDSRAERASNGDYLNPVPHLSLATRQPVVPGRPTALDIGLTPTDAILAPGHRFRVDVFASNFPKGLPLRPLLNDSALLPQHVQLDPSAPSFVTLLAGPA
ncbi:CocE/NonD family hydrolase [Skermania piniformis]|uniref:CocE/NonD family hydrolase n=1 Tax=Skermania pinensis TaxID=39122 RepID=A0ABX8SAL0_9ACTN|nr:CocE/NonD family hydrolase [Skermania piniformis]QXQ14027.1 CocE/NonD family hydrolase [Skermania piniformis]